jgi:hypothetical protein
MSKTLPLPAESPRAALRNRVEAAAYLGLAPATLADWAINGTHRSELPYIRLGKRCYYRQSDLDRFIESRFAAAANS